MIKKIPRTEMRSSDHKYIDQMETKEAILLMLKSHSLASNAVKKTIDQILEALSASVLLSSIPMTIVLISRDCASMHAPRIIECVSMRISVSSAVK